MNILHIERDYLVFFLFAVTSSFYLLVALMMPITTVPRWFNLQNMQKQVSCKCVCTHIFYFPDFVVVGMAVAFLFSCTLLRPCGRRHMDITTRPDIIRVYII